MTDARVSGYAVLWDQLSEDLGGFRERFRRGAFSESLADQDTKFMLRSHDLARPVASTSSGTLGLTEDERGLRFQARLPDSGDAGDLAAMVRRKVLQKMSFAFSTERASDESFEQEGGQLIRTIRKARLFEVSPVAFPAYPQSSIEARSLADDVSEREQSLKAAKQAERQRDLRRRRVKTAQAAVEARQTPPPEPVETIRARARQKRIEHAKRFGVNV